MGRGTHRGFITYEELTKSLGKRNLSQENISQAFIHILNDKKYNSLNLNLMAWVLGWDKYQRSFEYFLFH